MSRETAGGLDQGSDSLQLLMEMAESMERGLEPLKSETTRDGNDASEGSEQSGRAAGDAARDQLLCKRECGTSHAVLHAC